MIKNFTRVVSAAVVFLFGTGVYAQTTDLIISEYAEGSFSNKYVELYNGTGATVDLSNYEMWRISNGGTFPEFTTPLTGTLNDGEVIVIANSSADPAITGLTNATVAFSSATFFNGDDAIALAKDMGGGNFMRIDQVGTGGPDPGSGWDVAGTTNGTANFTLVRKANVCSPDTNWASTSGTTAMNSQWVVFPSNTWTDAGSHVSTCGGGPVPVSVSFDTNNIVVDETAGSITINIELSNVNADTVRFMVNYDTNGSSATIVDDHDFAPQLITLNGNDSTTQSITVNIVDDNANEGWEDAIITLMPVQNAINGTYPILTIDIDDDDFFVPTYSVDLVTADADGDFEADSLSVYCAVEGIVHGKDLDGNNGLSFHLIDATGGINVYNFNDVDAYTVNQGDELRVVGEIIEFNGLTEIFVDSLSILSTGNCIDFPAIIDVPSEATEAEYVELRGVTFIDTADWPNPGSNANIDMLTANGDTITIRVDRDTEIQDTILQVGLGAYNITGIGGQFDSSDPADGGYQVFPMFVSDIQEVGAVAAPADVYINELMPENTATIQDGNGDYSDWIEVYNGGGAAVDMAGMFISNDETNTELYRIGRCENTTVANPGYQLIWANGGGAGAFYANFTLDNNGGWVGLYTADGTTLVDSLSYGATPADTSYGRFGDGAPNFVWFATSTPDATNADGITVSTNNLTSASDFRIYPNPTTGTLFFSDNVDATVMNISGQIVLTAVQVNTIDISALNAGIYLLRTGEGQVYRIVKK